MRIDAPTPSGSEKFPPSRSPLSEASIDFRALLRCYQVINSNFGFRARISHAIFSKFGGTRIVDAAEGMKNGTARAVTGSGDL